MFWWKKSHGHSQTCAARYSGVARKHGVELKTRGGSHQGGPVTELKGTRKAGRRCSRKTKCARRKVASVRKKRVEERKTAQIKVHISVNKAFFSTECQANVKGDGR